MRQNSDRSELDELILGEDEATSTKEYRVEDFLTDLKCFYQLLNEEDFKKVKNFEQQVLTYIETQDRATHGIAVYNPQNNSIENIFTQLIIGIGQIIVNYENDKLTQLWHGLARIGKRFKFIDTNKLKSVFGLRVFKEWLLHGNVPKRLYADFEDIKKLGKGGFGKVVCARNKLDNVRYALKIIKTSDKKLHRHVSEVHILSVLDHPNIVNYKSSWLERNHSVIGDHNGSTSEDSSDYSTSNDSDEVKDFSTNNLVEISGSSGITFQDISTSHNSVKAYESGDKALARFKNYSNSNAFLIEDHSSINLTLYIQMEKCDMTLNGWLNSKRNLLSGTCNDNHFQDWDKLNSIDVLQGISKALEYIHSKNIVHHDVTPANIFINYNWGVPRVILADFGLACSDRQKADCSRKGTSTYSIPTDFDAICHPKNDLYSLGVVAYEVALECGTQYEVHKKIEGLKAYAINNEDEAINPKLWSIIKKLISKEVENRPTAAELLIEIEKMYIDSLEQALEGKNVILKGLTIKETNVIQMQQIMEKNKQLLEQLKEKDQQLMEKDLQLMEKDRQLLEKDNQIRELLEMISQRV